MNNTKDNDLFLNMLENPQLSIQNFMDVGLTASNTSLESEETYKNSKLIQGADKYNKNGKFDDVAFHKDYIEATKNYNILASTDEHDYAMKQMHFDRYDYTVDSKYRSKDLNFTIQKESNPFKIQTGLYELGKSADQQFTAKELAESQPTWDTTKQMWTDSPNTWFGGHFFDTLVMAQWEDDDTHIDPITGEKVHHKRGEYKIGPNGTFYTETLGGRPIENKNIISKWDTLTTDGSAINKYDFFDSDDLNKSLTGTIAKTAVSLVPLLIPGVNSWYTGLSVVKNFGKLMTTLGTMTSDVFGKDSGVFSNSYGFFSSFDSGVSEYAQSNPWAFENIMSLTVDVGKQLAEQRWIFEAAPKIFGNKLAGLTNAERESYIAKNIKNFKDTTLNGLSVSKITPQLVEDIRLLGTVSSMQKLDAAEDSAVKVGSLLSKLYMMGISSEDTYYDAKRQGASSEEAAAMTLGYMVAEWGVLNSELGKWILPETKMKEVQSRKLLEALTDSRAIKKEIDLVGSKAAKMEGKQKWFNKLFNAGKDIAQGNYSQQKLVKQTAKSLVGNALAEGFEEVSEEFFMDIDKSLANLYYYVTGDSKRMDAFNDTASRYALNFVGGALGGGLFQATPFWKQIKALEKMDSPKAYQQLVYMGRNGELSKFRDYVNSDKTELLSKNLSATKLVTDEETGKTYYAADDKDNQDKAIKRVLTQEIDYIQDILDSNNMNISDDSLISKLSNPQELLSGLKFTTLQNSAMGGKFLQDFNTLSANIVQTMKEINNIDNAKTDLEKRTEEKESNQTADLAKSVINPTSQKREKLVADLNEMLIKKDKYINGDYTFDYIKNTIFEQLPVVNDPYFKSTFMRWAETKENKNFNEISDKQIEILNKQYETYVATTRKDDITTASAIFEHISGKISKIFEGEVKKDYATKSTLPIDIAAQRATNEANNLEDYTNVEETYGLLGDLTVTSGDKKLLLPEARQLALNSYKRAKQISEIHKNISTDYKNNIPEETILSKYSEPLKSIVPEGLDTSNLEQLLKSSTAAYESAENEVTDIENQINDHLYTYVLNTMKEYISEKYIAPQTKLFLNTLIDEAARTHPGDMQLGPVRAQFNKVPTTPLLRIADGISVNLKANPVSLYDLFQNLQGLFLGTKSELSSFGMGPDVERQVKEGKMLLELLRSQVVAMRTEGADVGNLYGYNITLNELNRRRAEHLKEINTANGVNTKEEKLIELGTLNSQLADTLYDEINNHIKLLDYYLNLHNLNSGQKFNEQVTISIKFPTVIFNRLKKFSAYIPDDWEGKEEFSQTLSEAELINQLNEKPRINLTQSELEQLEKEKITLDNAIYTLFNLNSSKDIRKVINTTNFFGVYDGKGHNLTSSSTDISDTEFIYYLASRSAIKASDFYAEYAQVISADKAPIVGQELAAYLTYASLLNPALFNKFSTAIQDSIVEDCNSAKTNKLLRDKLAGLGVVTSAPFDTYGSPKYNRVTLIEGVAGSGKSSAVFKSVLTMLQRFHPELISSIWLAHSTVKNADQLKGELKVIPNAETFDRESLMKLIADGWTSEDSLHNFTQDEHGVTVSNLTLTSVKAPKILFIDEISRYSGLDLSLIQKFAAKNNIVVVAAGDYNQSCNTTTITKGDIKDNIGSFRFNFVRGVKLGTSFRVNNSCKSINNKSMEAKFETEEFSDRNPVTFTYNVSKTGLYGDELLLADDVPTIEERIEVMKTLLPKGEKIGVIYKDQNSEILSTIKDKYKDYISLYTTGEAQGLEGKYYIVITSEQSEGDLKDLQYWKEIYTGLSRSSEYSMIIGESEVLMDYIDTRRVDTVYDESLSSKSIETFAERRKVTLENALKSFEVKPTQFVEETGKKLDPTDDFIDPEDGTDGIPNPGEDVISNSSKQEDKKLKRTFEANSNGFDFYNMCYSFNTFEILSEDEYNGDIQDPNIADFIGILKSKNLSYSNYVNLIKDLRSRIMYCNKKSDLLGVLNTLLKTKGIDIELNSANYALKSSAIDKSGKGRLKHYKHLLFGTYKTNDDTSSQNKKLIIVLGFGDKTFEIPLLTINNPISMLNSAEFATVRAYVDTTFGTKGPNEGVAAYQNRIRLAIANDTTYKEKLTDYMLYEKLRGLIWFYQSGAKYGKISYIKDPDFTLGNQIKTGPYLSTLIKGTESIKNTYGNEGYNRTSSSINLEELSKTGMSYSKVYGCKTNNVTAKDGKTYPAPIKGKPFILTSFDTRLNTDEKLYSKYLEELGSEEQSVRVVYVNPDKVSFRDYVVNLSKLINREQTKNYGSELTAWRILKALFITGDKSGNKLNADDFSGDAVNFSDLIESLSNVFAPLDKIESNYKHENGKTELDENDVKIIRAEQVKLVRQVLEGSKRPVKQSLQNIVYKLFSTFGINDTFVEVLAEDDPKIIKANTILKGVFGEDFGVFKNVKFNQQSNMGKAFFEVSQGDNNVWTLNTKIDSPIFSIDSSTILKDFNHRDSWEVDTDNYLQNKEVKPIIDNLSTFNNSIINDVNHDLFIDAISNIPEVTNIINESKNTGEAKNRILDLVNKNYINSNGRYVRNTILNNKQLQEINDFLVDWDQTSTQFETEGTLFTISANGKHGLDVIVTPNVITVDQLLLDYENLPPEIKAEAENLLTLYPGLTVQDVISKIRDMGSSMQLFNTLLMINEDAIKYDVINKLAEIEQNPDSCKL